MNELLPSAEASDTKSATTQTRLMSSKAGRRNVAGMKAEKAHQAIAPGNGFPKSTADNPQKGTGELLPKT